MTILDQPFHLAATGAAGVSAYLVATGAVGDEELFGISVNTIRELGSFGLVALFVLGVLWLFKAMVPKILGLVESTIASFLEELKLERLAREQSVRDFQAMLNTHRNDLGAKLDTTNKSLEDGNKIMSDLVEALSERPCQALTFKNKPNEPR